MNSINVINNCKYVASALVLQKQYNSEDDYIIATNEIEIPNNGWYLVVFQLRGKQDSNKITTKIMYKDASNNESVLMSGYTGAGNTIIGCKQLRRGSKIYALIKVSQDELLYSDNRYNQFFIAQIQ